MTITSSLPLIFEAIDTNGDDAIAADEFATYFSSFGLTDTAFAFQVFKAMDTNNDGELSKKGVHLYNYNLHKNLITNFYT
jgi:Ca2+-binding EF-hand superfamily protein